MKIIKNIKSTPSYIWCLLILGIIASAFLIIGKIYHWQNLVIRFLGHALTWVVIIELTVYSFQRSKKINQRFFGFIARYKGLIYAILILIGIVLLLNSFFPESYYQEILFKEAIKNQDISGCLKLYKRDALILGSRCISKIAFMKDDPSICEKSVFADFCYLEIAKEKEDESICNFLKVSWNKDTCIALVAMRKMENSLCKKARARQDECEIMIKAIQEKNETLCNDLIVLKHECYQKIALDKNDPSICEKIDDKEICYMNVAISKKDIDLCKKVGERLKVPCKVLVKVNINQ